MTVYLDCVSGRERCDEGERKSEERKTKGKPGGPHYIFRNSNSAALGSRPLDFLSQATDPTTFIHPGSTTLVIRYTKGSIQFIYLFIPYLPLFHYVFPYPRAMAQ
jgi:hypothetical protein